MFHIHALSFNAYRNMLLISKCGIKHVLPKCFLWFAIQNKISFSAAFLRIGEADICYFPQVLDRWVRSTSVTILYKLEWQWCFAIVRAFIGVVDFSVCTNFRCMWLWSTSDVYEWGRHLGQLGVTGKWRRLHIEKHYDLYALPNIFRVIKPIRIRWAVLVVRVRS